MASKRTDEPAGSRGNAGESPKPRLRLRLATIDDVKTELARLYREVKAGTRETTDGSRMANMLLILGRLIEGSDLEKRLAALEAMKEERDA